MNLGTINLLNPGPFFGLTEFNRLITCQVRCQIHQNQNATSSTVFAFRACVLLIAKNALHMSVPMQNMLPLQY